MQLPLGIRPPLSHSPLSSRTSHHSPPSHTSLFARPLAVHSPRLGCSDGSSGKRQRQQQASNGQQLFSTRKCHKEPFARSPLALDRPLTFPSGPPSTPETGGPRSILGRYAIVVYLTRHTHTLSSLRSPALSLVYIARLPLDVDRASGEHSRPLTYSLTDTQ